MLTQLPPQIQQRLGLSRSDLVSFCHRWQIVELALFGSILRDDFHDTSDIDLLICFAPHAQQGLLTLAKIKHELEAKIGRTVDIIVKESIETSENWIRRNEILNTTKIIYE
ncbi:nucleotidyltransferase family protein [Trichothermofontia sp.]